MRLFDMDGPIMRVLEIISNLLILNLLTILLCIPIITAGASFTAMHYCCLKIVRGKCDHVAQDFFHSFKDNFGQSTALWLIFLLIASVIGFDLYSLYVNPTEMSSFVLGGLLILSALILLISTMVFPLQAKFINPIPKTLKTSFFFSFKHFPRVLLMMVMNLVPIIILLSGVGVMFLPLLLAFCFSLPGFLSAKLYDKNFQDAEDAILISQGIDPHHDEELSPL